MANVQPTGNLSGLLLPFNLSGATYTATSEAGPRPGVVTPGRQTAMTVEAAGVVTTGDDITLSVARAGVAEPAGGTFRWRSDPGEDYRDWDPPTAMSAWEFIDRSTTSNYWSTPSAVRLPSGRVCAVAVKQANEVVAWVQGAAGTWSSVSIENTGNATQACIDVLPSGRVQVWYVYKLDSSDCQIRMAYSDDSGATWTVGSARCLTSPILEDGANITRIRCRWFNGNALLLVAETIAGENFITQYASGDGGATFYQVELQSDTQWAAPEIVVKDNRLLVFGVMSDATLTGSSTIVPKLWTLASPGQKLSGVTPTVAVVSTQAWEWATSTTGGGHTYVSNAELAALADDDGVLYLYGVDRDAAGLRETVVSRSVDGGVTWTTPLARFVWAGQDTGTHMKGLAVVPERSRALLLHNWVANPGTADDSLAVAYLGGWTNRAIPWNNVYPSDGGVMRWGTTWLPVDKPDDVGSTWTLTTTGSPTATLGSGGLTIAQAGGEQLRYIATPSSASATYGLIALAEVKPTSGTAKLNLRISDGSTAGFEAALSITTTGITLLDVVSAATIATATVSTTSGVQVLLVVQKPTSAGAWASNVGQVRAAYRVMSTLAGPSADAQWVAIGTSSALTSAAYTTNRIEWGMASGAAGSVWRSVFYSIGSEIPDDTVAGSGFPTRGRTWCPASSPAYVGTYGARVLSIGGPAVIGDTWTVTSGFEHPVEAIDPVLNPSPRVTWRSTGETQQDIILTGVDLPLVAGDLIGIYLQGCNFPTCTLYADSSASTKIADIDMRLATGLGFTRTRGMVYPTGSAGSDAVYYLEENGLTGGTFAYSNGGTARRIGAVEAGNWRGAAAATTYRGARIHLTSYAGGDSGSGTGGQIWSDRVLIITDIATSTDTLMLRIPAATTANGYFEIGTLAIGRVYLWGQQYSRSRSVDVDTGVETVTTASGGRRVYRPRPRRKGLEWAWTEGLDTSQLYNAGSADYVTLGYTSAPPAQVGKAGVPTGLHGLLSGDAAKIPVVAIPGLPQASAAPTATAPVRIIDPSRLLWSRIVTQSLRLDSTLGQEFSSPNGEVFRVGTCRAEEEL